MRIPPEILRLARNHHRQLLSLDAKARRAVEKQLSDALEDVRSELDAISPETFRAQQLRLVAFLADLTDRLTSGKLEEVLTAAVSDMYRLAPDHTAAEINAWMRHYGQEARPLNLQAIAAIAQESIIERVPSSLARWGPAMARRVRVEIASTLATRGDRNAATEAIKHAIDGERWRARRIVRTEMMGAYNQAHHLSLRRARDEEGVGDLKKSAVVTFDARTADDSLPVHGQVRELEEEFVDGKGRRYLHPPGRPNDREKEIPWLDPPDGPSTASESDENEPARLQASFDDLTEDEYRRGLVEARNEVINNTPLRELQQRVKTLESQAPKRVDFGSVEEFEDALLSHGEIVKQVRTEFRDEMSQFRDSLFDGPGELSVETDITSALKKDYPGIEDDVAEFAGMGPGVLGPRWDSSNAVRLSGVKKHRRRGVGIFNITGTKPLLKIRVRKRRSYYSPSENEVVLRRSDDPEDAKKRALFHELGHWVEARNERVFQASKLWLLKRAQANSDGGELVNGLGSASHFEAAWKDVSPWNDYVGKLYIRGRTMSRFDLVEPTEDVLDEINATEVFSMGVEAFASPDTMIGLMDRDFGLFVHVVAVLRGKYGYKGKLNDDYDHSVDN